MAERLGMTVTELFERMTAEELLEWIQFDRVYLDHDRVDTARLCLRMDRLAGQRSTTIEDYLPPRWQPEKPPDINLGPRLKAVFAARIAAQNRRVRPLAP